MEKTDVSSWNELTCKYANMIINDAERECEKWQIYYP